MAEERERTEVTVEDLKRLRMQVLQESLLAQREILKSIREYKGQVPNDVATSLDSVTRAFGAVADPLS